MIRFKELRFSDSMPLLALGACFALLLVNVQLRDKNKALYLQIELLEASDAPAPGAHISLLRGVSLEGKPLTLDLSRRNRPTLLYIMSPACPICTEILPTWKAMADGIGADNVIFADLSGSIDKAYLKSVNWTSAPNALRLNAEEGLLHGFRVTPTTILLNKDGTVSAVWAGVMDKHQIAAFNHAFLSAR